MSIIMLYNPIKHYQTADFINKLITVGQLYNKCSFILPTLHLTFFKGLQK